MRTRIYLSIILSLMFSACTEAQLRKDKSKNKGVKVEKVEKTDDEWKKELTPSQYYIVREKGTEAPFSGKYWNLFESGNYECIACGSLLFESTAKFNSSCGWPSFFQPGSDSTIEYHKDKSLGMNRTEVTCATCNAHLGHVFQDGPEPTGLRYCINSESLRFIPEKTDK